MSDELEHLETAQVSRELKELVERLIDNRLSGEQSARLEELLADDEMALSYCAERVRFHAEVEEVISPVKLELMQKRHVVLETKKGLAKVSSVTSNVVRLENPKFGKVVELPPNLTTPMRATIYAVGAIVITGLLCLCLYLFLSKEDELSAAPQATRLEFRNPSFEALEISKKSPPVIYTILEWQDYFQTTDVQVCDVERASNGERSAKDGNYAAIMRGGYLTQRLTYDDGEPLVASLGLKLRVSGWAMLETAGKPCPLSISARVVVSAYPSMVQAEPSMENVMVKSDQWEYFEVELELPSDSLMVMPKFIIKREHGELVDIEGLNLAVSIDNRKRVPVFVDALNIELISQ